MKQLSSSEDAILCVEARIFKTVKQYHRQLNLSSNSLQKPSNSKSGFAVVKSLSTCVTFNTQQHIFQVKRLQSRRKSQAFDVNSKFYFSFHCSYS